MTSFGKSFFEVFAKKEKLSMRLLSGDVQFVGLGTSYREFERGTAHRMQSVRLRLPSDTGGAVPKSQSPD